MLSRLQEMALITRCITFDDRDAFSKLVVAYSDDIRRLLDNLTEGDSALVDDLAQESFIKAYLSLRSFNGMARFRTWLYRIAYNEFVNHLRSRRKTSSLEGLDLVDEPGNDLPYGVEPHTLEDAISSLPPIQRTIIRLYYYDNFSVAQISRIVDHPQGTVKAYLNRARKRLATFLVEYENET